MTDIGDTVTLTLSVSPHDATTVATITVTPPTGAPTSPTPTTTDIGATWTVDVVVNQAGWWLVAWTVTGIGAGVEFRRLWVGPAPVQTDIPNVEAVTQYLGAAAASWSQTDIQGALNAEAAAQRAVCRIPVVYSADLGEALKRRVQRNLAMRQQPLAVLLGDAETGSNVLLPGRDPEVRRLERPYPRLVVG
mgnify:CR=1 FL=1